MLGLNFNFGRVLSSTEKLTPAKFNAIVKGIVATITGTVSTSDLDAGAVTPAKTSTGAYFYASGTLAGSTYTAAYAPIIAAYTDGLVLAFKAGSPNNGAANLDSGAGAKPLVKNAGQNIETGDILAGQIVEVRYNSTLVAGGCWEITSVMGSFERGTVSLDADSRNLVVQYVSATAVDIDADELVLKNSSARPYLARNVNLTVAITTSGANGLDTGAEAISTWYYLWVIYNPTTDTVAGLLSVSGTAPTLPAGYTYKALVGEVRNNSAGDFVTFYQQDRRVFLNATALFTGKTPAVIDVWESYQAGGGGSDVDLRTVIPPNAKRLSGIIGGNNTGAGNNMGMEIAADANGLGAVAASGDNIGVAIEGFSAAGGFEIPIKTAQTFYWRGTHNAARARCVISGYTR